METDIKNWGKDPFKLISRAYSEKEDWFKSIRAMEIYGIGCIVQTTTQITGNITETLVFVPGVVIMEDKDNNDNITSRKIVSSNYGVKRQCFIITMFVTRPDSRDDGLVFFNLFEMVIKSSIVKY